MQTEKSVWGSLFGITRLCRVMPNSDSEGWIFIFAPNKRYRFFFLHTFLSPAFDFNVGIPVNIPTCWSPPYWNLTSYVISYVMSEWCQLQTAYQQTYVISYTTNVLAACVGFRFLSIPWGWIWVCKIRFVSTGENRRKPCLVCKNILSQISSNWSDWSVKVLKYQKFLKYFVWNWLFL